MNKISALVLLLSMLTPRVGTAQTEPGRVFFGGNLGLNFSSDFWLVNLSPMVGYQITPPLSGGVGLIYQYESHSRPLRQYVHSYGGSVFARYDLSANLMKELPFGIFFQTDYEGTQNNVRFKDLPQFNENVFINRLFVGAGYIQSVGSRGRVFLMLSIDLLNRGAQPLLRGGFFF